MTTPHKALLIQARDALRLSATPLAKDRQEVLQAIAALTAAIDSPEPKGLFIDLIAQHEGLAEELRDLPEPYDQQALEPCPVCGWKAIVPGEPCLMCERNARMLAPEPEPVAWIGDSPTKGNGRRLFWTRSEAYRYASNITPLYAAAGAAPAPSKPQ